MRFLVQDLSKGFVSCSRCGIIKNLSEVYKGKDGVVHHLCDYGGNIKILVDRDKILVALNCLNAIKQPSVKYTDNFYDAISVLETILEANLEPDIVDNPARSIIND